MKLENLPGAYLVCENADKIGSFTLFVRVADKVVMYPILYQKQQGYFVSPESAFSSIQELITHYREQAEGLGIELTHPCCLSEDKNEVDRKQLKVFRKKLSSGQFGEVRQGLLKATSVTVKILTMSQESCCHNFLHEAHIMQRFNHPNIVRLIGLCTQEKPYYIITEFLKHGNLFEYLNSNEGKLLGQPQLIKMAAQVASGMLQLELCNYIHRNLAAQNILVGENLICKVGNFQFAQVSDLKHNFPIRPLTKWTAPEALMYQNFSSKSDVWSFGIVLYELITQGETPYPDMKDQDVEQKLRQEDYHMPRPKGCSDKLYNIMQQCWKREVVHRPTFKNLQQELSNYTTLVGDH